METLSFDAWGKRRAASLPDLETLLGSWTTLSANEKNNLTVAALLLSSSVTHRGFTGHEQMDGVGLIHMNGRVYDAEIGRFLSADPFIQDRTNLQALNRYSYVENNPLSYTDPSGFFLKKLLKKVANIIRHVARGIGRGIKGGLKDIGKVFAEVPVLQAVVIAVVCVATQGAGCTMVMQIMAGLNGAIALANGAPIGSALMGAAIAFVAPELGGQIAGQLAGLGEAASYGGAMISGGIAAKANGGKFIDGVKGSVVGLAIGGAINRIVGAMSIAPADAGDSQSSEGSFPEDDAWLATETVDGITYSPVDGSLQNTLLVDASLGVDSGYWARARSGGAEGVMVNGVYHTTLGVKWTDYDVSINYEMYKSKTLTIKDVPSPGHKALGGAAVYGQKDIPRYHSDGTAMWKHEFEKFRVNSKKHPGLYNKLPKN